MNTTYPTFNLTFKHQGSTKESSKGAKNEKRAENEKKGQKTKINLFRKWDTHTFES